MELSLAGAIFVIVGVVLCCFGMQATLCVAAGSTIFVSTEVASVTALGGASITVPQFGLVCLILLTVTRRDALERLVEVIAREPACQVLLLFMFYAVASSFIFPRLFSGKTEVFTLARIVPNRVVAVPLAPSSGNVTQTLYMMSDVIAFFCTIVIAKHKTDVSKFVNAFKFLVAMQVTFAFIDTAGKYINGGDVLSFLHTASYVSYTDVEFMGLPRITATYAEASHYAVFSAGQIAFCFAFWRATPQSRTWAALFLLSVFFVALSTSSSAYAFLALATTYFLLLALQEFAQDCIRRSTLIVIAMAWAGLAAVLAITLLNEAVLQAISEFFDSLLISKGQSESGIERSTWNAYAVSNLIETAGMGIGLGSARSSSWILSLLAQMGVLGAALYLLFIFLAIGVPRLGLQEGGSSTELAGTKKAFRAFVIAMPLAATISWNLVDLGIAFHMAAALAIRAQSIYSN